MDAKEILCAYAEDYLDDLEELSYDDLLRRQTGGFASLAFGAAGIALAHWHAGLVLADEELVERAERWSRAAVARQHGSLAFLRGRTESGLEISPWSLVFGRAGVYFVRALVAHARQDAGARRRAVARLAELSRRSKGRAAGLYHGTAGCLAATAVLLDYTGARGLRLLGDELAEHLIEHAVWDREELLTWPGVEGNGLAHGAAGPCLALLLWSAAAGGSPPSWLSPCLARLLEATLADPRLLCPQEVHHPRLCSGFTGLTLVAARAHRILGQPTFLAAARRAGRLATARPPPQANLCCGRAGVAFACLALAHEDPDGPWRRHAEHLALSALPCDGQRHWDDVGLFYGETALACLALNLAAGIAAGPPCFDLAESYPKSFSSA